MHTVLFFIPYLLTENLFSRRQNTKHAGLRPNLQAFYRCRGLCVQLLYLQGLTAETCSSQTYGAQAGGMCSTLGLFPIQFGSTGQDITSSCVSYEHRGRMKTRLSPGVKLENMIQRPKCEGNGDAVRSMTRMQSAWL